MDNIEACRFRNNIPSDVETGVMAFSVEDAKKTGQPICGLKVENGNQPPVCTLPNEGTNTCPIALFWRGKITLAESRLQLLKLYNPQV
ncbi:MAG TPA: hypothetical protein VMR41_04970 [Patescibacteria group bacterium]|nr:hypothetical protein [Patescibacteria group bacterium]